MFFSNSRGRRIGTTVLMAGVATISALSLTGCATQSDRLTDELTARGFSDVKVADDGGGTTRVQSLYFAAGGCRGVVEVPDNWTIGNDFTLHFTDIDGGAVDFVSPGNASAVTQNEAMAYCVDQTPAPIPSDTE